MASRMSGDAVAILLISRSLAGSEVDKECAISTPFEPALYVLVGAIALAIIDRFYGDPVAMNSRNFKDLLNAVLNF